MRYIAVLGVAVSVLALALFAWPVPALASTLTVDSTNDAVDINPGDGVCDDGTGACTLRAAIQEANALLGADTINLPAGTYTLTIAGIQEDAAATGDLDITDDLALAGAGAGSTTIDGANLDRVFHIFSGATVDISGVTMTRGREWDVSTGWGGGIRNAGDLTLSQSTVSNSQAQGGGGIFNESSGIMTIADSLISTNKALAGGEAGGGIHNWGTLDISGSTISGNWTQSSTGNGGGILNAGTPAP